jgi:CBS domain-containing protein
MFPTTREAMTPDPVTLHASMPIRDAARAMRDMGIGDVLVRHADGSLGIVTDRDLAIRALADGADPDTAPVGDFSSDELVTVDADDSIDAAVQVLKEQAVRRVPVLADGKLAGIVTVGDLARRLDPSSMLADISAAPATG